MKRFITAMLLIAACSAGEPAKKKPATASQRQIEAQKWLRDFDALVDKAVELKIEPQAYILETLRRFTLTNTTDVLARQCKDANAALTLALKSAGGDLSSFPEPTPPQEPK